MALINQYAISQTLDTPYDGEILNQLDASDQPLAVLARVSANGHLVDDDERTAGSEAFAPLIDPYERRWRPALIQEGNPEAPYAGLWLVRVPEPRVEERRNQAGESYQHVRRHHQVSVFDQEAYAVVFAESVWRRTHELPESAPGPDLARHYRWTGPPSLQADAWLERQSDHVRNQAEPASVYMRYVDPAALTWTEPHTDPRSMDPMEERRKTWALEDRWNAPDPSLDVDGDVPTQLDLSNEEQTTLYLQAHPQRKGYFLWQGVTRTSQAGDVALLDAPYPVAVIPVLFQTPKDATSYGKDLGFATITPVASHRADPSTLREAGVPKHRWTAPTLAVDLFNRVSRSPSVLQASWKLPVHAWQTAPVSDGLSTTWVAWRVRAGIGYPMVEMARDPQTPARARHFASLDAVRRDYPTSARHPVAPDRIAKLAYAPDLGDSVTSDPDAPCLDPVRVLLKRLQGPERPEWLETLIATNHRRQVTWAESRLGGDVQRWNVTEENPYAVHERAAQQYLATGTLVLAPAAPHPAAPIPESVRADREVAVPKPVAYIAEVAEGRWGLYTEESPRRHEWLRTPPSITRIVPPPAHVPETAQAPAAAQLGPGFWVAVPKDYVPRPVLVSWTSPEAAADDAREHAFQPERDPRAAVHVQRELRAFETQPFQAAQAQAFVAEVGPGQYGAWIDRVPGVSPEHGLHAWVLKSPEPQAVPSLETAEEPGRMAAWLRQRGITAIALDPRPAVDVSRELFHYGPVLRPGARLTMTQPHL